MVPHQYYEAFVLGNYDDFKNNIDCIRRAFNVSVAASHLADHYFEFYKKNEPPKVAQYSKIGDYVRHITQNTNGAFKDIRSISNAYKHLYTGLDPRKAQYSSISSAGTIEIAIVEKEDVKKLYQDFSDTKKTQYTVFYTRKTGEQIEFLPTLEKVVGFWEREIVNID